MRNRKLAFIVISLALATGIIFSASLADINSASAKSSGSDATSSAIGVASDSAVEVKEEITISATSKKMGIGEQLKLKLKDLPDDAKVTWKSTNKKIATVTKKGVVRALAAGKATIKATVGSKTLKCKIKVKNTGFEGLEYTMGIGETLTVHIKAGAKVKWSLKDPSSDVGAITGKSAGFVKFRADKIGTTTIKAKSDGRTYYCNIKVIKENKNVIYLTFDDGPSTYSTPKILNILKKNGVNATFFIINYNKDGEKLIKRELEEGNAVAIHGYSHDYAKIYKSDAAYINNVTSLQDKIYKSFGVKVWATRFPGGSSNLVSRHYNRGIMKRLVKKVEELGFAYFDWNVSSGDAGGANNSAQVYANVTKGLRKNRNNIVLMHDFSGNNKTIGALDSIIKYGKSHGYTFKVIDSNTTPVHHGVQN